MVGMWKVVAEREAGRNVGRVGYTGEGGLKGSQRLGISLATMAH